MERKQRQTRKKINIRMFNIVQRLYDKSLITEEEKLKMEVLKPTEIKAAIFELMSQKIKNDPKVAPEIFLAIKSVKDEKELRNPMEINTIFRNIYGFLNVEDLKSCRVVCKKWNFEAESLIRKNAVITFGHSSDLENCITKLRHPKNFLETFRHFSASGTIQTFTSFRFLDKVGWRFSDLMNFLDQQKNNIQDLQLCGFRIFKEDVNIEEGYDKTISLPNLKYLKVQNFKLFGLFFRFAKFPNLRVIEIYGTYHQLNINMDWIPKSVKRMKLNGIENIIGSSCNKLELEKLVLENYSLRNAAKVLGKIRPNILVFQWERQFEISGTALLFLRKFKNLVLFIGPFIWDDRGCVFEKMTFMTHLDMKAEYYVFQNNQGRGIQRKKFEDMTILEKN